MDKLINKHIDTIEELELKLEIMIDEELSKINIDAVIGSPQELLSMIAGNIKRRFLDEFADKAIELGFDFGKEIEKRIAQDNPIKIDNSKDPKLNDQDGNKKQD